VQRFRSKFSASVAFACAVLLIAPGVPAAAVTLKTSDTRLAAAFDWARRQALAYAFSADPVGDWYEASLPGREAFCMRDVAHQSLGAHFLGLASHTRNMLRRFAENISDSKDWCSYWEIDRNNRPAPVDYKDDTRFWYNLPANFDVLDACFRMYTWTGDASYVSDPVFQNFYRRTVYDYVARWDLSADRIMARPRIMNIRGHLDPSNRFQRNRGIPSYDEGNPNFVVAIDQLAAQYAGYVAHARFAQLRANSDEAKDALEKAAAIRSLLNETWWDKSTHSFYARVNLDHRLEGHGTFPSLLYYGALEDGEKSRSVLASILDTTKSREAMGVEGQSHLPEILYRYEKSEAAYEQILDLTREDKARREYPEVSYSVIGAIVSGLMGIQVENADPGNALTDSMYVEGPVSTLPRLTAQTQWAEIDEVPVRNNYVRVRHDGLKKSSFQNVYGPSLIWNACFPVPVSKLSVNGTTVPAKAARQHGQTLSCASTPVGSGDTATVEAIE
jgi:tetratricopeptide (TPR) repeat protein